MLSLNNSSWKVRWLSIFVTHDCLMHTVCTQTFSLRLPPPHTLPACSPLMALSSRFTVCGQCRMLTRIFPSTPSIEIFPKFPFHPPEACCAPLQMSALFIYFMDFSIYWQKKVCLTSTVGRFLPRSFISSAQYLWSSARCLFSQS